MSRDKKGGSRHTVEGKWRKRKQQSLGILSRPFFTRHSQTWKLIFVYVIASKSTIWTARPPVRVRKSRLIAKKRFSSSTFSRWGKKGAERKWNENKLHYWRILGTEHISGLKWNERGDLYRYDQAELGSGTPTTPAHRKRNIKISPLRDIETPNPKKTNFIPLKIQSMKAYAAPFSAPLLFAGSYINDTHAPTGFHRIVPLDRSDYFRIEALAAAGGFDAQKAPNETETLYMVCDFSRFEGGAAAGAAQRPSRDHCKPLMSNAVSLSVSQSSLWTFFRFKSKSKRCFLSEHNWKLKIHAVFFFLPLSVRKKTGDVVQKNALGENVLVGKLIRSPRADIMGKPSARWMSQAQWCTFTCPA